LKLSEHSFTSCYLPELAARAESLVFPGG
jgi:hypothetical protein